MASSLMIDIEQEPEEPRGAWRERRVLRAFAYPEDTERACERLLDAFDDDGDECEPRFAITPAGAFGAWDRLRAVLGDDADCLPDPPAGWEDADLEVTIVW